MSAFDLFPAEAATKLESGHAADLNAGPGVLEGVATAPLTGLAAGATGFARTLNLGLSPIAGAVDEAFGTNTRDWWFQNMMLERTARKVAPNPRETGVAGQILHSLFDVGGQAVTLGPAGVLVSKTIEKSMEGVEQGLDVSTAMQKGAIEGGGAALGVALPIAMPYMVGSRIPGLLQQIGYGVGTNVPLGIASRALTHKVLEDAGYRDMAEQYKALDESGLMADVVLGTAFGALGHAITSKGAKLPLIRPADIDAALAKRNAYHLEVDTAPGLSRTGETRDAHVDAVLKATEDLMEGRPVNVSAELRATDFQPMPELDRARAEVAGQSAEVARPLIEAQAETRAITEPAPPSRPAGEVEQALRTHFVENPGKPAHVALSDTGEVLAWSTSKKRLEEELAATKEQVARVQHVTAATLDKLLPRRTSELAGKSEPLGNAIEPAREQQITAALKTEGVAPSRENVETVHLIARAREIDKAAVDALPDSLTDAEYLDKVKGIIDDHEKAQATAPNREGAAAAAAGARAGEGQAAGEGEAARRNAGEAAAGGEGARPVEPLTIEHPEIRTELETMAKEAGWAEVGGRLIRIKHSEVAGDETISRTTWIPKAEWWPGRPGKLNEHQTAEAVRKALAGEKLTKREQRALDYMVEVANEHLAERRAIGEEEMAALGEDLRAEDLEPTHANVVDVDLVTRASAIDEAAVERAAAQYENDDHAFLAEIQRIVDDHEARSRAPTAGGGEAGSGATQGESRPALELSTQTDAELRAKEAQAATGNVEERSAALRDRNEAILSSPEGTAPARSVAEARVPTQQEGLFGGAEMQAVIDAELRSADEIIGQAPDMLVPDENGALVRAEELMARQDEQIAAAEASAKGFDAAVRCATRAGG